jgi:hypothetical protein
MPPGQILVARIALDRADLADRMDGFSSNGCAKVWFRGMDRSLAW